MFGCVEAEQPVTRAMNDGVCHDHFGIEQCVSGKEPVKITAMPVRPIDHGSNGESWPVAFQWVIMISVAYRHFLTAHLSLLTPLYAHSDTKYNTDVVLVEDVVPVATLV